MTKFVKEKFNWDGEYLVYGEIYPDRRFVARFKRNKGDRAGFTSFLIKNFAVEEYFRDMDAGGTPYGLLEAKGYISATMKKALKSMGYEPTIVGKKAYLADQVKKYAKA
jgi:hypothetical protein